MCIILIHPETCNYSVFFAELALPQRSDSAASAINVVDFEVNSEKDYLSVWGHCLAVETHLLPSQSSFPGCCRFSSQHCCFSLFYSALSSRHCIRWASTEPLNLLPLVSEFLTGPPANTFWKVMWVLWTVAFSLQLRLTAETDELVVVVSTVSSISAMKPWSSFRCASSPPPPVLLLRGHSVVEDGRL